MERFKFEIYLSDPITKQKGYEIAIKEIIASNYNEALTKLKEVENYDCIILDYYVK